MKNCADNLCPVKTMMVRRDKQASITSEILELINDRDTVFVEGYTQHLPELIQSAKALRT